MKRRRWLTLGLVLSVSVLALPDEAEARRGFGFSRSFGTRSFGARAPRSMAPSRGFGWGSRQADGYQNKGGLFGAQKSRRGQAFTRAGVPRLNQRGQRMLPRQTAVATRATRAQSYQRRHQRPTTVINNRYTGGAPWGGWGYGFGSVGMWDLFFLSTVTHMFWHHHWHDASLQKALYQDNLLEKEELAKLEQRVKELEAAGVKRDPNYLPEDVDPDLAYAKTHVEQNPKEFYADEEPPARESSNGLWTLLFLGGLGAVAYFAFLRRY